ncbi:MAG TPA: phosphoglucosamine mutase [Gammaproteobacteria bacterium]|nr:phosphoglucosamine mutase [Gammaproteobacteria bacterium]
MRRWFGTDGIRGRVGIAPLTPEFVLHLGWATARVLGAAGGRIAVVGKDTRRSGYMFESALEAGFSAAGMDVLLLGPIPTPAIAHLTRSVGAAVGVVISASHNPYGDNGIKFFGPDGRKLADATEADIENALAEPMEVVESRHLGGARRMSDARERYVEFCKASLPPQTSFAGMRLVLDCAHGATYAVAPRVFRDLGAEVIVIAADPDGLNINDGCGSMHPAQMIAAVREHGADYGFAFDGDGDRVLAADASGRLYDGDDLLYVMARERAARGMLTGSVVGTVMSNLGLEQALAAAGIGFERVAVGDRHVLARLDQIGGVLGGETSGHIICLDRASSGDGIIAALEVLAAVRERGRGLAELLAPLVKRPQLLRNVPLGAASPEALMQDDDLARVRATVEARLGVQGRVLLRPSGTEPLLRIMVEGPELALVEDCVAALVAVVEERLALL